MGNKQYTDYINSEKWKSIRVQLFIERGKICEKCGCKTKIEVHHLTYVNFGREKLSDLMVLCRLCHNSIHNRKAKKPKSSKKGQRSYIDKNYYQKDGKWHLRKTPIR